MTALKDIPVKVETAGAKEDSVIGGGLIAILREIAEMLERLVKYEESGAIDLRTLPLGPEDYRKLVELLGNGEIEITLKAGGPSLLRETAYCGVWWIQHRNDADEMIAELLEIARIPAIAVSETDEIVRGIEKLNSRLSVHTTGGSMQ